MMTFSTIFVHEEVASLPYAQEILKQFPQVIPICCNDADWADIQAKHNRKNVLVITKLKGESLKPCPGTTEYSCCGYQILNIGLGCLFNCHYCILQDYLPTQMQVVFANVDEYLESLAVRLNYFSSQKIRIGTGEFTDSLVLDHITHLSERLIQFFSKYPNIILELKTKSVQVETLLKTNPNHRVVIAWSVNPESLVKKLEKGAPSLEKRLQAAKQVAEHGFDVAFHFDPIVPYPGFEADYEQVVDQIFRAVNPEQVRWISMGMLRFTKGLKDIFYEQASEFIDEMIVGNDNKYRFLRPRRIHGFKTVLDRIRHYSQETYVYLCMESTTVWDEVFGFHHDNNELFDEAFNKSAFKEN